MQAEKLKILRRVLGDGYKASPSEYLFYCPKCDHHKKKLAVRLDKGFHCWVCDYSGRNIRRLIRSHGTYTDRKAWNKFENQIDISDFELILRNLGQEEEEKIELELPREFQTLVKRKLPISSLAPRRYLRGRGLTKDEIYKWKIGYCNSGEYEGFIIIPSFDLFGELNFFVARCYDGGWRKYKNPKIPRNRIIFDELFLDFKDDLTIVEGVFDAIATGDNSVPLLGSTLSVKSKLFHEIIKNQTTVFLALDADADKKTMKIVDNLLEYGIEVYKIDTTGYEDVAVMPKEIFLERKQNAMEMNVSNSLLYRALSVK